MRLASFPDVVKNDRELGFGGVMIFDPDDSLATIRFTRWQRCLLTWDYLFRRYSCMWCYQHAAKGDVDRICVYWNTWAVPRRRRSGTSEEAGYPERPAQPTNLDNRNVGG